MTTERDPGTRTVMSWLREDSHENAERVLLRALDEVDATPQRRSWWPAWRFAHMNKFAQAAVAAAAVLVVVVSYNLLPRTGGPGGQPSPIATPEPTKVPRLPGNGPIVGTYEMGSGPTFFVTVPPGWVSRAGRVLAKNWNQPSEVALVTYPADIRVFADACRAAGTQEEIGPTTADLIAALEAQENSEIADPVDAVVGGLPGKRLEISAPAGLNLAEELCTTGGLYIWQDADGELREIRGEHVATAYVADTPGGRLLFVPNPGDGTSADIAELNAIVASIEIANPTPTASP